MHQQRPARVIHVLIERDTAYPAHLRGESDQLCGVPVYADDHVTEDEGHGD